MNVFVSVGTQLPFDRLVRLMDLWSGSTPNAQVFAQTGQGAYVPQTLEYTATLGADDYRQRMQWADIVVSHAGVGSLLSAMENSCRLILVPRRYDLGEHRTDHQMATATRLGARKLCYVAKENNDLYELLKKGMELQPSSLETGSVSQELLENIRVFAESDYV